jgi:adenosine deaminase CECR1
MLEHMEEEIEKFKKTPEGKDFWGARMIWTTIRQFNKKQVVESTSPHSHPPLSSHTLLTNLGMKQCIEMKLEFPSLIAGYDLVGQEDLGRPLSSLAPELFWFRKACARRRRLRR